MARVTYTGLNMEAVRKAMEPLKPRCVLRAEAITGGMRIDQVWPDGQVSAGRWFIKTGDSIDTVTGDTYVGTTNTKRDDTTLGIGIDVLGAQVLNVKL